MIDILGVIVYVSHISGNIFVVEMRDFNHNISRNCCMDFQGFFLVK